MSITSSLYRSTGLNRNSSKTTGQPASPQQPQVAVAKKTVNVDNFGKAGQPVFAGKKTFPLFSGGFLSTLFSHEPSSVDMVWLLAGDDKEDGDDYDQLEANLKRAFIYTRLSEDRNWSGRSLTMEAIHHGNYKEALLIASYGGDPDEEYDRQGRNTLAYVDARKDLTSDGKEALKKRLVELYKMWTTNNDDPRIPDARRNIPTFVTSLPKVR